MSDGGGENFGFGDNGFQMMGMMNALKTGDMHTDMLIAMCVPFVLKMLFEWVKKFEDILDVEAWKEWWKTTPAYHERYISHSTTRNYWGGVSNADEDTQNSVLIKAIKMYLHQVVKLNLRAAHLDLTGMEDGNHSGYYNNGYDSDDDSDDGYYGSRRTLVGTLSRYKIINRLPNNEWHDLGDFGPDKENLHAVSLCIENQSRKEGEDEKEKTKSVQISSTTFHFTSPGEGAIDAFIDTAYKWYIEQLRKLEDNSRYLYEMKVPELRIGGGMNDSDGGGGSDGTTYKRYKLSDQKSFDSLFFREKENLLSLVDHFTEKSGKYSIRGYPHKLGVLLHGPPGTGKTSLIKALAHYTGRSIVNVPLSRVSTNSELMSIFFDRKYKVEGAYVPVKLGFKDVIFVMEDVDAAAKIVKRRDGKTNVAAEQPDSIDLPTPKSLWRMLLESTESDCQELVKTLCEKSERLKKEAEEIRPQVLQMIARRVTAQPALGLVGEGMDDPNIARICKEAMTDMENLNERYSKLNELLSSHASSLKSMLEAGASVDSSFEDELLGETDSLSAPLSTQVPKPGSSSSSSSDADEFGGGAAAGGGMADFAPSILDSPPSAGKGTGKGVGIGPSFFRPNPDALSLSGLLNVLDGVVDTPGRIIIMTTNHPEMLDPALIRPGRVDKKLLLGYMAAADIVSMLEHYFQTKLDKEQVGRVEIAVNGNSSNSQQNNPKKLQLRMTPAQVEQLAVEHDELDDMIAALEKMSPAVPKSQSKSRINNVPLKKPVTP